MPTTVHIPIDLRNPQASANAGNAFFTVLGLTAWDAGHWEFVTATTGNVDGLVRIPHNLAATPNAGIILVCAANATTGNVVMTVSTARVASGGSFNPASLTAETAQTITVPATARNRFDITFPATGNLGVVPVADDELIVRVDQGSTSTLAVNLELYEAVLRIDLA